MSLVPAARAQPFPGNAALDTCTGLWGAERTHIPDLQDPPKEAEQRVYALILQLR